MDVFRIQAVQTSPHQVTMHMTPQQAVHMATVLLDSAKAVGWRATEIITVTLGSAPPDQLTGSPLASSRNAMICAPAPTRR